MARRYRDRTPVHRCDGDSRDPVCTRRPERTGWNRPTNAAQRRRGGRPGGRSGVSGGVPGYGEDQHHDHDDDDFSAPGGYDDTDYDAKWQRPFPAEPDAIGDWGSSGGALRLDATPFTLTDDSTFDHIKYFATSVRAFTIPEHGTITFSAEIEAETPGTDPDRLICPAPDEPDAECRTVYEAQQACATLHMLNFHETGALFDWLVGENQALPLTERLLDPLAPGVGLDRGYTQILEPVEISGAHEYAIRYSRAPAGADRVEWLLDGRVVATQRKVGIPLDVQNPGRYRDITYPSIDATGEILRDQMNTFLVGHGLFILSDVSP